MNRVAYFAAGLALMLAGFAAAAEVVPVVSPKNPVSMLSRNQAADIFLGRANRFPDGRQAVPIDQAEGSPAREEFYAKFAGKSAAQVKAHWSKIIFTGRGQPPQEAQDGNEVKRKVAANPDAIGYIEQNLADGSIKVLRVQ